MSRIFRDSSVLNQYGSPSLNSNTIANRPTFGQTGRLFISTDTRVIYRDTGSAWEVISSTGATQNLQQTTENGNTSNVGIFLGLTGSLTPGLQLQVSGYSRFSQTVGSAANLGSNVNQYFELQTTGTTIAIGTPSPSYSQLTVNMLTAQTIGGAGNCQIGAGLFENVITDTGASVNPLTISQTSGISALSPIISYGRYTGLGGATINKYAGLVINGIQATGGSALTITDNYQLLINSSQQFTTGSTITNKWGIYQAGVNDDNYFAAKVNIGTTVSNSYKLNVVGNVIINGDSIYMNNPSASSFDFQMNTTTGAAAIQSGNGNLSFRSGGLYTQNMFLSSTGNLGVGTTTPARKLTVAGQQEWITTVGTGTHTTSGNHLPIWVNGTQYWLALLNPPILP